MQECRAMVENKNNYNKKGIRIVGCKNKEQWQKIRIIITKKGIGIVGCKNNYNKKRY
jgi:hypothetical protein